MTLPLATLDHVVINARDNMDHAADVYRRLGFTLTERGYHSLGSMNHLAMFGTDYPVSLIQMSFDQIYDTFKTIASVLPTEDQAKLFHDTAKRFYRL